MSDKCPVCEKLKEWLDGMIEGYGKEYHSKYVLGVRRGFINTKDKMAELEKECEDSKEGNDK